MRVVLAVSMLFLAACGSGASQSGDDGLAATDPAKTEDPAAKDSGAKTDATAPLYVADAAGLPTCDAAAEGRLAYVKAEAKFKACASSAWANVEIKGDKGDKGDAGANGTDNHIVGSISCGGELGTTGVWFSYQVAQMASGDVFAHGSIRASVAENGASVFYSSKQVGAATAAVQVESDLQGAANAGYWRLTLDRATLITSIDYYDSDATGGHTAWVMTPDKCVGSTY